MKIHFKATFLPILILIIFVSCTKEIDIEDAKWLHKDSGQELQENRIGQGIPFYEGEEFTGYIVIKNSESIVTGKFPYEEGQLSGEFKTFDNEGNIRTAVLTKNNKIYHRKYYTANDPRFDSNKQRNKLIRETKYKFFDNEYKNFEIKSYLNGVLVLSQQTYSNLAIGDIYYKQQFGYYGDEIFSSISGFRKIPADTRFRINYGEKFGGNLTPIGSFLRKFATQANRISGQPVYTNYSSQVDGGWLNLTNRVDIDIHNNETPVLHGKFKIDYLKPFEAFEGFELNKLIDTESIYFQQKAGNYSKETPIKFIEATFDEGIPTSLKIINTKGQIIYSNDYNWELNRWGNVKRLTGTR